MMAPILEELTTGVSGQAWRWFFIDVWGKPDEAKKKSLTSE